MEALKSYRTCPKPQNEAACLQESLLTVKIRSSSIVHAGAAGRACCHLLRGGSTPTSSQWAGRWLRSCTTGEELSLCCFFERKVSAPQMARTELRQAEARKQVLLLSLPRPCRWQQPKLMGHPLLLFHAHEQAANVEELGLKPALI